MSGLSLFEMDTLFVKDTLDAESKRWLVSPSDCGLQK